MVRVCVLVGLAMAGAVVGGGAPAGAAVSPSRVNLSLGDRSIRFSEAVDARVLVEPTQTARPTGTVAIVLDGTTTVASVPLRASAVPRGSGTAWLRSLPAGEHTITAVYSGDSRYAGATSHAASIDVRRANTTTVVRSLKPQVATGTVAKLTARVAPVAPAAGTPTGTVTFKAGSVVRTVPLVRGLATWKPRLPDGPYQIVAVYEGTADWEDSPGEPVAQRIGPDPVPEVDQAVTGTSGEVLMLSPSGPFTAAAQVFTAGVTGRIETVDLDAVCFGGMGGPGGSALTISIKALSGDSPTGAILGTGTATEGTVGDDGLSPIALSTPAPVTQGTRYAIVVAAPQLSLGCQLGQAQDGQSLVLLGPTWNAEMGTTSLRFRTWVRRP